MAAKQHPPVLPSLRQFYRQHAQQPLLSPTSPLLERLKRGSAHFTEHEGLVLVVAGERPIGLTSGAGPEPAAPELRKLALSKGVQRVCVDVHPLAARWPETGDNCLWYSPGQQNRRVAEYLAARYSAKLNWTLLGRHLFDGWRVRDACLQGLAFGYDPFWVAHWCHVNTKHPADPEDRHELVRRELFAAWQLLTRVRTGDATFVWPHM